MKKIGYLFSLLILCNSILFAQEEEDWADEEEKTSVFFGGINVGAFFANKNTAIIYTGSSDVTPYGINYIFNQPQNKLVFDQYFQYPYAVVETPQNPSYKVALDIGLHAGINLNKMTSIYVDINTSQLKYEQFFTVAIDDPASRNPEPIYEKLPIIGEEKRLNINLGTQLSLYQKESSNIYWSLFGNFNNVKLERNYIVVNNVEYEIRHTNPSQSNTKPGGVGVGGGTGLGFKFGLTDNILIDFTYNLYYTKVNLTEAIQPYGMQHGLLLRILWN